MYPRKTYLGEKVVEESDKAVAIVVLLLVRRGSIQSKKNVNLKINISSHNAKDYEKIKYQ